MQAELIPYWPQRGSDRNIKRTVSTPSLLGFLGKGNLHNLKASQFWVAFLCIENYISANMGIVSSYLT